jgi:hypothetical protein
MERRHKGLDRRTRQQAGRLCAPQRAHLWHAPAKLALGVSVLCSCGPPGALGVRVALQACTWHVDGGGHRTGHRAHRMLLSG